MQDNNRVPSKSPRNTRNSTDLESQSYESLHDNRLSSSFTRSYYSNLYKPTQIEDDRASYTQDEDSLRNQTLALANQGLLAVNEEIIIQGNNDGSTPSSNHGYQSNLSQLINLHSQHSSPKFGHSHSSNVPPVINEFDEDGDMLDKSDEDDFEEEITNSRKNSPLHSNSNSRPMSPRSGFRDNMSIINSRPTTFYETTPLIGNVTKHHYDSVDKKEHLGKTSFESENVFAKIYNEVYRDVHFTDKQFILNGFKTAFLSIPAVLIGTMLNILDAVSFGIIIFPTALPAFSDFGPDGISMFLVSTVISQFVYSAGGSRFGGGNGGFMIEVVPFLHIICNIIVNDLGESGAEYVVPTAMITYALSSIITGLVFFGLGWFKLGSLMEFFPRHILIGCIGGVGAFLLGTAMELTTKISPTYDWDIWYSYLKPELLPLWTSSLALALILQGISRVVKHPLLTPGFFLVIPIIFYIIIAIFDLNLPNLRNLGWLFPLPYPVKPFYDFYLNFNFYKISWYTIPKVIPAIFALTFFGILHVPINVPALAVSTRTQDVDVNRELVGHGISNFMSGIFGSVQNYLIYSNSVLIMRSGGDSRISGMMLCFATFIVLLIGPQIVGYIPTPLVGSLIFHMGLELIKEAVYDTYSIVHPLEYFTIISIVLTMALIGFIEGIFLGILLACLFFVVIYSSRSPIKTISDGTCVSSTVRRLYHQRTFLEKVGNQVKVIYLQGFMFFGTVHQLDHSISQILKMHKHQTAPIRFIILDFSLVGGIDFSATDAFSRILYRLSTNDIFLVLSGLTPDSEIGLALRKAGIWTNSNEGYVKYFEKCNQALEWCENTLLSSFYQLAKQSQDVSSRISTHLGPTDLYPRIEANYSSSPRNAQLHDAAANVYSQINETSLLIKNAAQPLGLLIQAFHEIEDVNYPSLHQLSQYFELVEFNKGDILWRCGDIPDAIYILENGLLRVKMPVMDPATQDTIENTMESILPGTFVGEVTFLTKYNRTATVYTDTEKATLWKLSLESYQKILEIGAKHPNSPEANIPYLLTKLALTYSAYDNKLYSAMAMI